MIRLPSVLLAALSWGVPAHAAYDVETLWVQGDAVARATLAILVLMSVATWYLLAVKLWEQSRLFRQAKASRRFWRAENLDAGMDGLAADSPFLAIAQAGKQAADSHSRSLADSIDRHSWVTMCMQRAVGECTNRMQDGLSALATIASTAPFIGLFGTVWGIHHALAAIGIAGQASIDKVAGPVGEALIMTAIGLAVAVPAVMAYNWLVRRNKVGAEQLKAFASDLHSVLLGAGR